MFVIIKNLKLTANSRAFSFVQIWVDKVFNPAICAFGNLEIYRENEVFIFAGSYDISTIS